MSLYRITSMKGLAYLTILGFLCQISSIHALDGDKKSPLTVNADRADIDKKNEVSTYQGNVKINQGSLQISADQLTISHPEGKITSIIATGLPAHYQYQASLQTKPVIAHAQTITYIIARDKVTLNGDAFLQQGENQFNGQNIIYDIKQDHVQAHGTPAGKQITITITPDSK